MKKANLSATGGSTYTIPDDPMMESKKEQAIVEETKTEEDDLYSLPRSEIQEDTPQLGNADTGEYSVDAFEVESPVKKDSRNLGKDFHKTQTQVVSPLGVDTKSNADHTQT